MGISFQMWFYFLVVFPTTVILLYKTDPIWRIFSQHCKCWWHQYLQGIFQMNFHFLSVIIVILLYDTGLIRIMFSQHYGYWWLSALAPGHQKLQCLSMHPCISSCLWVISSNISSEYQSCPPENISGRPFCFSEPLYCLVINSLTQWELNEI